MNEYEILVPIIAILVGGTAIILPIAGLTARFALKPLVEAYTKLKSSQEGEQRVALLERRLALVEEQMHSLERDNQRLLEDADFRARLGSPQV